MGLRISRNEGQRVMARQSIVSQLVGSERVMQDCSRLRWVVELAN